MKRLRTLAATAALLAFAAGPALAAPVFDEDPFSDAGDSLATAADTGASLGKLTINGAISLEPFAGPDFVDLFKFNVAKTGTFRARTGSMFDPGLIADPVLYLFNASGVGVAMDDESGGEGQASLTAWLSAGDYYLAIAFAGVEPLDAMGGPIFDAFGSLAVLSMDPLDSWLEAPFAQNPSTLGAYSINMSVPLPGTLALALAGCLAAGSIRTRRAATA